MSRAASRRADLERSASLFAALGDPTRLELVARLAADETQSITRLTAGLGLSRQAVSKHLRVLASAGFVRRAAAGRESRWTVEPRRLDVARHYLDMMSQRWDDRLRDLERHLEPKIG